MTRSVEYWHSHTGNMKQFERSISRGYPRGLDENCVLTEFRLFETMGDRDQKISPLRKRLACKHVRTKLPINL